MLSGSENSAVLLALRWYMVFQIIQYLISRDNYTICHMTLLAKKPKKMLEVYQTLLPARGWGLGTRLVEKRSRQSSEDMFHDEIASARDKRAAGTIIQQFESLE